MYDMIVFFLICVFNNLYIALEGSSIFRAWGLFLFRAFGSSPKYSYKIYLKFMIVR
jgi:hypothetical protein